MWLIIIWAVFVIVFLVLGIFHWSIRNKSISYLQLIQRRMPEGVTVTAEIAGVNFGDFADKFNRYIDYYNQTTRKQHIVQAIGYWVASAIALFSLTITLIG